MKMSSQPRSFKFLNIFHLLLLVISSFFSLNSASKGDESLAQVYSIFLFFIIIVNDSRHLKQPI